MSAKTEQLKKNLYRRIAMRTAIFVVWLAGLAYLVISGASSETGLGNNNYLYMMVALCAVWAIQLIRDIQRLRNEDYLKKAAIREADERSVMIAYKATRMAVIILICAFPIAICVLAFLGQAAIIDALACVVALFAALYLGCFYYFNSRC